jgi:hypothetical protein
VDVVSPLLNTPWQSENLPNREQDHRKQLHSDEIGQHQLTRLTSLENEVDNFVSTDVIQVMQTPRVAPVPTTPVSVRRLAGRLHGRKQQRDEHSNNGNND